MFTRDVCLIHCLFQEIQYLLKGTHFVLVFKETLSEVHHKCCNTLSLLYQQGKSYHYLNFEAKMETSGTSCHLSKNKWQIICEGPTSTKNKF